MHFKSFERWSVDKLICEDAAIEQHSVTSAKVKTKTESALLNKDQMAGQLHEVIGLMYRSRTFFASPISDLFSNCIIII